MKTYKITEQMAKSFIFWVLPKWQVTTIDVMGYYGEFYILMYIFLMSLQRT